LLFSYTSNPQALQYQAVSRSIKRYHDTARKIIILSFGLVLRYQAVSGIRIF